MTPAAVRRVVLATVATAVLAAVAGGAVVAAQTRPPGRGRGLPPPGAPVPGEVAPLEIQRLFDAYLVMQAQQELQLTDDQFPRFLSKVRALQEARRRWQMERRRILQDLRRLADGPAGSQDDEVRAQLKALTELDSRQSADLRQALDGVDQVLDLRQQARFRVFEEQMERRKVELMMRARQGNRPRMAPPQP
jgi:hypothetical protein